jgi:hypothetical protein
VDFQKLMNILAYMKTKTLILSIVFMILAVTPTMAQKSSLIQEQQRDSFKQKIEQLQKEGKLAEISAGSDSLPGIDAHFWTYEGKLVKIYRRWKFTKEMTFNLPSCGAIDRVVFSYENGHRTRVISDLHQKGFLCEVVQTGSYSKDEGEETGYYIDSQYSFGEVSGAESYSSSAPTTLKFIKGKKEILSIEVRYDDSKERHPGEPVVKNVKNYIVRHKSSKTTDYNFENPVLNLFIEKYSLDITRELGLIYGK